MLQVLFYAQMASEPGYFTIADVIAGLNRKLIRRHPHVFGDQASAAAGNAASSPLETSQIDSGQVLRNWEAIKRAEKPQQLSSALDGVPRALPSLLEAAKLGARAHKGGFDWPDVEGIFAKLEEETEELRQAIRDHSSYPADLAAPAATTQEAINALCPMIVSQVVPGQEEGNYELLRRHRTGTHAPTPDAVIAALQHAFAHQGRVWREWRKALVPLAHPTAAAPHRRS